MPSAAVVRIDDVSQAVLDALADRRPVARRSRRHRLATAGRPKTSSSSIDELLGFARDSPVVAPPPKPIAEKPKRRIPLQTLVLNVTSKCNLSCGYCYEYGEDRIVEATTKPRFMNEETAQAERGLHVRRVGRFADGESDVLRRRDADQLQGAASQRSPTRANAPPRSARQVNASLTTNATLLREEIIDWIVENDVGVTVSIDGAREQQDKFRIFSNGMGSYDIILPNIKQLLARHRRRPVGARVTLTGQNLDVVSIYKHLFEEIGFWEVGFAPVTTSWQREYAIQDDGFQTLLSGFQTLAADFLQSALAGRRHGFSNVRDTLEETAQGHEQGLSVRRGTWPHGRGDRRRRRALPSLRGLRRAQAGHRVRRRRSHAPGRLPHQAPHREQD